MKKNLLLSGLMVLALTVAQASVYEYNYTGATTVNLTIPDGNPGGVANNLTVSGLGIEAGENSTILDVNVYLNISGGYNGDLYGYLVAPNGSYAILLNRIGRDGSNPFGNSGAGIVVNLDDDVGGNIHTATFGSVSGTYNPDGRAVDPATVVTGDSVTQTLADIGGSGTGTWTLFMADMSGGDVSTLVSWGLQIDVVPEPTTWAMIIFGSVAGITTVARRLRRQQ